MADVVAVILAAGPATRLKSDSPKALHRVCGQALLEYALDGTAAAGLAGGAVGVPPDAAGLTALAGQRAVCVPGGGDAADAVHRALGLLPPADDLLILPCDLPQLQAVHLQALLSVHRESDSPFTLLVVGGVPTGVYAVRREAAVEAARAALDPQDGGAGRCELPGDPLVDVNTRADLARAGKAIRQAVAERLMDGGVTFIDPDNTYVDAGVRVGRDTILYPGTFLEGRTEIGCACTIGPNARLANCILGDAVTVEASVIRESRLGPRVHVGPYAQVRPGCDVGEGTKLGDFVELKNARVGARVSIAHLAYVGDAIVGDRANIGAGVITCNYDGFRKNQTVIGEGAFVGSNSVLIAPVTVGPGAYVAANSTITQDVPADALGIGRARQENKEEWARRRREMLRKD